MKSPSQSASSRNIRRKRKWLYCRKTAEQEQLIKTGLMGRKEKANYSPQQWQESKCGKWWDLQRRESQPPGTPKPAVHLNPTVLSYPSRRADSRPHSFSKYSLSLHHSSECWAVQCWVPGTDRSLSAADPGQDQHGPLSLCAVFKCSCRKSFPV